MVKILAVDPGKNSGFAVVDTLTSFAKNVKFGTIRMNDNLSLFDGMFTELIEEFLPNVVIFERMEIRGRGYAAKDLLPICEQIGRWTVISVYHSNADIYYFPPSEWKGNTSKEVTRNRVERFFGLTGRKMNDHEVDALGLIFYALQRGF